MDTVQSRNNVLDRETISRKIRRMALEIAEQNSDEKELIIAGINGNGEIVARSVLQELKKVSSLKTSSISIQLNKKDPRKVQLSPETEVENKVVIVVDDVSNTGKTMLYALKPFLNAHPRKIQTLVLVERSHKLFPVHTDYTGLSITTTLQEHISVETDHESITGAWLH